MYTISMPLDTCDSLMPCGEQVNGKELSLFSDVFSFGTIMWEVLMQMVPHGHIADGAPLEAYSFAISHGLEPKGPTMQDLRDCSAEQGELELTNH